jgi:hypothetical protein
VLTSVLEIFIFSDTNKNQLFSVTLEIEGTLQEPPLMPAKPFETSSGPLKVREIP